MRYLQDPESKAWNLSDDPWITTIVDLDTGQVLGIVDGRDHKGTGDWPFARPAPWHGCRWWKEVEVLIVTGATTGR
ncbi:hypothetical protein GCM10023063_42590 [Arthrobacter methylotrophus]|uniref:Uncharacterized protein n=1 Tax=Arthrobacter methylotrophus TaxID=121291 RepID=A0ABV5UX69_9MICC